ncbi:DNA methyltransferase [Pseudomonas sp.]|uniref:DNA methyltransferase n=1 Tax=Pseudomonas sp. TaxID=306 RepID=UPI0028B1ECEB|nr:DNA methyltransferase [Pseudomonas sp.]
MTYTLHLGDCIEAMRAMPDNSVDSIVTDPPYGLSFMGKKWDYDVPGVDVWAECLRVLKPGGHLLAFAGTRTQHRMAVRIEDAGFEIRDMIAWVYGSGFPKSLDVSKAIDKAGGNPLVFKDFAVAYRSAVEQSGMSHTDIDRAIGLASAGSNSCYWARDDHRGGLPPRHHWEKVRDLLALPSEIERMYDAAEREVLFVEHRKNAPSGIVSAGREAVEVERQITAPATDAASQWSGWGTALKPALEPVTVARKPLIGTVAANVMAHGTGALNIDACRAAWPDGKVPQIGTPGWGGPGKKLTAVPGQDGATVERSAPSAAGRWPANLIHDGSDEVVALFPAQAGASAPVKGSEASAPAKNTYGEYGRVQGAFHADAGSAARFFYCAKTSRMDRNEGLGSGEQKAVSSNATMRKIEHADWPSRNGNHHPTVKPTDLMAYLCRLVTPPGGMVLDPFMGSGSTGKAAIREGFHFIGCELDPEYLAIAKARIEHEQTKVAAARESAAATESQLSLFGS